MSINPGSRNRSLKFQRRYAENPKKCKGCQSLIPYKRRYNDFCSHSCTAKFYNKTRIIRRYCKECGKEIVDYSNKLKRLYCGRPCHKQRQYSEYIRLWLLGEVSGIVGKGMAVSSHVKRWLRENRGDRCELCGWNQRNIHTGKIPVQVDHEDGNHMNTRPENVRLLCPNCHSLTPTYGGRNKGHGRKCRRDRYAKEWAVSSDRESA